MTDSHPYSTAAPLISKKPDHIADELEQFRIASYDLYEDIYWTVPDTFEITQRGDDDKPIAIPSAKTIVETIHRYLANDLQLIPDPAYGTPEQQANALLFWTDMVRRERFYSKFNAAKRMGLIRGDWVFHMRADPERLEGARVSIETIHPGNLFPLHNEEGDVVGYHIIKFVEKGDTEFVERTTYFKTTNMGGPSPIALEVGLYEKDSWGGPGQEKEVVVENVFGPETFPDPIDQLPIYHIKNFDNEDWPWGSSELRGIERLIAAVDQGISDEELELVLNGLGVYATNMDAPLNDDGTPGSWDMGPGRVVQTSGTKAAGGYFERVTGTTSVAPQQDHLNYLHNRLDESAGIPKLAKGNVDVDTAESGVARLMEMGPILAHVGEKEKHITDVLTNYMYDLAKWVVAYEGGAFSYLLEVRFVPVYGEKLPVNEQQRYTQIMAMATAVPIPVIPLNVAWDLLREIGFELPDNDVMLQAIIEQRVLMSSAEMDSIASRIDQEAAGDEEEDPTEEDVPAEALEEQGDADA